MTEGIIVALITGGVTLAGVLISNSKAQAVMAENQGRMGESVERLEHKVDTMEDKPAERWDKLISSLIGALGGAFLVWVASGMPGV